MLKQQSPMSEDTASFSSRRCASSLGSGASSSRPAADTLEHFKRQENPLRVNVFQQDDAISRASVTTGRREEAPNLMTHLPLDTNRSIPVSDRNMLSHAEKLQEPFRLSWLAQAEPGRPTDRITLGSVVACELWLLALSLLLLYSPSGNFEDTVDRRFTRFLVLVFIPIPSCLLLYAAVVLIWVKRHYGFLRFSCVASTLLFQLLMFASHRCSAGRLCSNPFSIGTAGIGALVFSGGSNRSIVFSAVVQLSLILTSFAVEKVTGCGLSDPDLMLGHLMMANVAQFLPVGMLWLAMRQVREHQERLSIVADNVARANDLLSKRSSMAPALKELVLETPEQNELIDFYSTINKLRCFIADSPFVHEAQRERTSDPSRGAFSSLEPFIKVSYHKVLEKSFKIRTMHCCLLSVGLEGINLNERREGGRATDLAEDMTKFVTIVTEGAMVERGTIVRLFNGSALVMWKTKLEGRHEECVRAVRCARQMVARWSKKVVKMTAAVHFEECFTGHVRSDAKDMAMFVVSSSLCCEVNELQSLAGHMGCSVVVSSVVQEKLNDEFVTIMVDIVNFFNRGDGNGVPIYEVIAGGAGTPELTKSVMKFNENFDGLMSGGAGSVAKALRSFSTMALSEKKEILIQCWRMLDIASLFYSQGMDCIPEEKRKRYVSLRTHATFESKYWLPNVDYREAALNIFHCAYTDSLDRIDKSLAESAHMQAAVSRDTPLDETPSTQITTNAVGLPPPTSSQHPDSPDSTNERQVVGGVIAPSEHSMFSQFSVNTGRTEE
eukprot:Sspe_Gene.90269::Locus_61858_Transcript_1_1_Confidence_1.000_Length_2468::g.90269::m.90269